VTSTNAAESSTPVAPLGTLLHVVVGRHPDGNRGPTKWVWVVDRKPIATTYPYWTIGGLRHWYACTRRGAIWAARRACREIARSDQAGDGAVERFTYESWIDLGGDT
jgi:hypothetical protein